MYKLLLLLFLPLSVRADMISPSHNCVRPAGPSHLATDGERASFALQVAAHRQCLMDFIDEQNKEARLHSEAARMANDELKRFGY